MRDNSEDANMRDADMSPSDRKEESAVALANGGTQPGPSHEDETHANQVDTMITDARTENKDRTLKEFLGMMDQYAPIIPDAVTDYYLSLAGFECEDHRVKRLLALAAQKFVADMAQDAYQYSKIRATSGNANGAPGVPVVPRGRFGKDRGRAVLTMDDLGSAVHEYGINLKRQDFMR